MAVTWRRILFADELSPNASGIYAGSSTFNGSTGATVTIGVELAGTSYAVSITPTGDSEDVGVHLHRRQDRHNF